MCSTFKGAGRAAMLDRNSTAHLDLRVRYRAADVVPFSPITESHVNDGLTIGELCDAAIVTATTPPGTYCSTIWAGPVRSPRSPVPSATA